MVLIKRVNRLKIVCEIIPEIETDYRVVCAQILRTVQGNGFIGDRISKRNDLPSLIFDLRA